MLALRKRNYLLSSLDTFLPFFPPLPHYVPRLESSRRKHSSSPFRRVHHLAFFFFLLLFLNTSRSRYARLYDVCRFRSRQVILINVAEALTCFLTVSLVERQIKQSDVPVVDGFSKFFQSRVHMAFFLTLSFRLRRLASLLTLPIFSDRTLQGTIVRSNREPCRQRSTVDGRYT